MKHWTLILATGLAASAGCSQADSEDSAKDRKMVFVCTKTGAAVVADKQQAPAVNPETGQRTLMPGLYCPKCKKWYPSPPLDVLQRNPNSARCPKTGEPLTADGPWPREE
jgi:hypothetical protein